MSATTTHKWYENAVVYQIYPRSFYDSNNDGVGDLNGIRQKLDYIKSIGVNVIWLCPVYSSPMVDNGYDISDYRNIDPSFGTMSDMDNLIKEAGEKGMKVLMDLVVNHCSDKHAWFQEALKDPKSKYANYFIFSETDDGKAPNNIRSHFGDPAWTRVPNTNRWYFHAFAPEQPDLNWENPELRQEIYDMVNWWLDKGLGGFRIDAIGNIKKEKCVFERNEFPSDAPDGLANCDPYILSRPGVEVFLRELNEKTFKPHDAMTVAEVDVPPELLPQFIGPKGFFSMAFDFSYTDIDVKCVPPFEDPTFTVDDVRANIFKSQLDAQAVGWTAPYLENHDQSRSLNKYIAEKDIGFHSATMLGTLFMCLRGTPFIYEGEELGMTNCHFEIDEYNDVLVQNQLKNGLDLGKTKEWMLRYFNRRSRDNARTPFQWTAGANAGFTTGKPWLKVNPNHDKINVETEDKDPKSVLNYYRKLVNIHQKSEISDELCYGDFKPANDVKGGVIAYYRSTASKTVYVINNYLGNEQEINKPKGKIILNNYENVNEKGGKIVLAPYQSLIYLIE